MSPFTVPTKLKVLFVLFCRDAIVAGDSTMFSNYSSRSTTSTCTEPLGFVRLPNSFSAAEYNSYRGQCTDKCNAEGYCCTKGSGICNKLPCTEGCHIAFFSDTLTACKAECTRANGLSCEYTHSAHSQVAEIWSPSWPYAGVGKKCHVPFVVV